MVKQTTLKFKEPKLKESENITDLVVYSCNDPTYILGAEQNEQIYNDEKIIPNVELYYDDIYSEGIRINDLIEFLRQLQIESLRVYGTDNIILGNIEDEVSFPYSIIGQETPKMHKDRLERLAKLKKQEEERKMREDNMFTKHKADRIKRIKREAKELGLQVIG